MIANKQQTGKAIVLAAALALLGGCASNEKIEQAQSDASAASSAASQAESMARSAKADVAGAVKKADAAQATADAALAKAKENEERLNRMYEKSMAK